MKEIVDRIAPAGGWRLTPRGFLIFCYAGLTGYVLHMIEQNPQLLANASFMQFIGQLTTGGLLLAGSAYFQTGNRHEAGDRLDVDVKVEPQSKPDPFKIDDPPKA